MGWADWLAALAAHPVVLVGVGSAAGGILRYAVGRWVDARPWAAGLPWGTFAVNLTGSLLLGFLAVACLERLSPARRELYLLLGTGLCGGYTTFSTFAWETYALVRDGRWPAAAANVAGSCAAGVLGAAAGALLAHLLFGRR